LLEQNEEGGCLTDAGKSGGEGLRQTLWHPLKTGSKSAEQEAVLSKGKRAGDLCCLEGSLGLALSFQRTPQATNLKKKWGAQEERFFFEQGGDFFALATSEKSFAATDRRRKKRTPVLERTSSQKPAFFPRREGVPGAKRGGPHRERNV